MEDSSILPRHNPQIMDPKAYTLPLTDLDKSGTIILFDKTVITYLVPIKFDLGRFPESFY